jgi:iron complex outermembrane receptor protein
MKKTTPFLSLLSAFPLLAAAADADTATQSVLILGAKPAMPDAKSLASSDATSLLRDTPGASIYSAGGVSGLPALRGLADDRIKIRIDGGESTAACGNHMNAPLSYIDPTQVHATRVMAGITPVSAGGDNIAGVIDVTSIQPAFAVTGQALLTTGSVSLQSRSIDDGLTKSMSATVASQGLSATYTGAAAFGDSYKDGHGDKVLDTLYKSINQSVTLGGRTDDTLVVLKVGEQRIPYQGFANQYMDMTDNHAVHANLNADSTFGWGTLHAKLFWQNTEHEMGFISAERPGAMPMNTHGRDASYSVEADLPVDGGTLKLGNEFHRYRLDDWWPPLADSMMMGPDTYRNINDGRRDRFALYGEWDGRIAPQWTMVAGVRGEAVRTNAGDVRSYDCGMMMCGADDAAAAAFNAESRARLDNNIDFTLSGKYEADSTASFELGIARKTRSPNLYERYSWGRGTMAMTMIGWFGDANGYVGNVDLRPEVANTLSATADWHDERNSSWFVRVTPFYTAVHGFIDVDTIGSYQPGMVTTDTQALLQFANHDAHLYGVNLSWQAKAWSDATWGEAVVKGKFDWTRGRRNDGGDLYHVMPPNLTLGLAETVRAWTSQAELQLVAKKSHVDQRRDEPTTPGYALVNLGTQYQFPRGISLQAGIRNLFDRQYALPLGGVDLAAFEAAGAGRLGPLPGQGRSFDVGLNLVF